MLALLATTSGCFLAPGMQMDEHAVVERGRATTGNAGYRIIPITSTLVTRLMAESEQPAPPARDPLANEALNYNYFVGPTDVLQVTVWDHPELTTPTGQFRSPEENGLLVKADGTMFYPYVGTLSVAGKTISEISIILTQKLARVVANPQLDVRVAAFRSKKVQVTGEVANPTTVPITDVPLRVQDALAAAKGFTLESDFSRVTLSRDGKTYFLNLQNLYEKGDLSQNWLLKDGDVVNVSDRSRNKVFVMGEVRTQQSRLMIRGRMTLLEALTDTIQAPGIVLTNGFDPSTANVANIYVIRGDYEAPNVMHLDASSADALILASQFPLQPRDVVFVSTYELARFNRVMLQILPTVQAIWQTYDIIYRSK